MEGYNPSDDVWRFDTKHVLCKEGHEAVVHTTDKDCPACKEISKRLTEVNALEVKLALAEDKISMLEGTLDSLNAE